MVEGHVVVTNASCQSIEHDNVFDNTLIVLHEDVVKSVLGISDWVKSAKIRTEVTFEFLEVSHPSCCGVLRENVRLEPFQSSVTTMTFQYLGNSDLWISRLISTSWTFW